MENPRGFGEQIAEGAKEAACTVYRTYAKNYVPRNPLNAPITYFWDSVCTESVFPPPPPYTGGQCLTNYRVWTRASYRMKRNPEEAGIVVDVDYRFNSVFGPIQPKDLEALLPGAEFGGTNRAPVAQVKGWLDDNWELASGSTFTQWNQYSYNVVLSHYIYRVERLDGAPDNCGDPHNEYPPSPVLPSEGVDIDIDVESREGNKIGITLNFNDIDFNMPVTFRFDGGFIQVDFGGVHINWSGDFNWNAGGEPGEGSRSPFPEAPPPGSGGGGRDPQPGDKDVEEKPPEIVDDDEEKKEQDTEDEEILWVQIVMTKPPYEKHTILYKNPGHNVYYGGWLAWTDESGLFNSAGEIPIRRSRTLLKKPSEYKGYAFRAINGAQYQVTSYTQKIVRRQPGKEGSL